MIFFFENLSLLPETREEVMGHFKLLFGSGNSDLAKIRPLKVWTSWISPWVPPYGILPRKCRVGLQAHRAELPPPAVASSGWQIGTPRFPRSCRNKNPARVQRTEGALKIAT